MNNEPEIDDCCKPIVHQSAGMCPECEVKGKPVSPFTISMFLKDPKLYLHPDRLPEDKYFLCESRSCHIVYFNSQDDIAFRRHELRVKVWQKENDSEVPVCYCFNNSVKSIQGELKQNGTTDVLARISAEVKAGNCRCEVTNPQGSCCLGNVTNAVKMAKETLALEPLVETGRTPTVNTT